MSLYLAKLGIHTEYSIIRLVYFWGIHCPLSPSLSLCLQSLSLDMVSSIRVTLRCQLTHLAFGEKKGRKPLTFYLVTTSAQPIFSYPQLSSFLYFCFWIVFTTKLHLWLDIFSAWESWEQINIILTSGFFSCAMCYSKHLTRMTPFNSHNSQ